MRRRGHRRRVALGTIAVVAVLAALRVFVLGPVALGPGGGGTTGVSGRVGEHHTVGAGGFEPHGSRPVHVRAVRLTGVSGGVRVVGIWAVEGPNVIGALNGDPDPRLRPWLRPVTDMVFHPGAPRDEWALVIVLTATEPGDWTTTGIDVDWSTRWRRGTSHYKYRFGIKATA
jgi:hypothetical protein